MDQLRVAFDDYLHCHATVADVIVLYGWCTWRRFYHAECISPLPSLRLLALIRLLRLHESIDYCVVLRKRCKDAIVEATHLFAPGVEQLFRPYYGDGTKVKEFRLTECGTLEASFELTFTKPIPLVNMNLLFLEYAQTHILPARIRVE